MIFLPEYRVEICLSQQQGTLHLLMGSHYPEMSFLTGPLTLADLNKLGSWHILFDGFPQVLIKVRPVVAALRASWLLKPSTGFHFSTQTARVQLDQQQKLRTLPPPQFSVLFLVSFLFWVFFGFL